MTGSAFQLFPPPPRIRQTSPAKRPHSSIKPTIPESALGRKDSAGPLDPSTDLHELLIQVDSVSASPSASMTAPQTIISPPQAHVSDSRNIRTPPSASRHTFGSPQRQTSASPNAMAQDGFIGMPASQSPLPPCTTQAISDRQSPHAFGPALNRAGSPAFSSCPTLVRGNSTATRVQSGPTEDTPMRSMFPVYNPILPLAQQTYKPAHTSPTHIAREQISRSPYSPSSYIPHSNISTNRTSPLPAPKTFFTPSHLLDNLWLATNGQEEPTIQIYTLKMHHATGANPTITFGPTPSLPFYSLAQSNSSNAHELPVQSIANELLIQRHHPTQPRVLPIAHLELTTAPSLDSATFDPQQQESTTLLTNIYPKLAALQALDTAASSPAASHIALSDPTAQSPAAQRLAEDVLAGAAERECCTLAWTRDDPKQQSNPWSQHIPMDGSYQLHHPTLGTFPIQIEGDCSVINKPSNRPITAIYAHNVPSALQLPGSKPASISLLNPYILSPTTPHGNLFPSLPLPPRVDGQNRPISVTPSEMSVGQLPGTTDAAADDATLARLDFTNDALTLNLGALVRFGNPFLTDVVASTLLAVAVAEATRGRPSRKGSLENFELPPLSVSPAHQIEATVKTFKGSFFETFKGLGGKTKGSSSSTASRSPETSFDKDIELGEWYGQGRTKETKAEKRTRKKQENEDKLPFVARTVVAVVKVAFKTVVWVMRVLIQIVARLVMMLTRKASML